MDITPSQKQRFTMKWMKHFMRIHSELSLEEIDKHYYTLLSNEPNISVMATLMNIYAYEIETRDHSFDPKEDL